MAQRALLDQYAAQQYAVEDGVYPQSIRPEARHLPVAEAVRVVQASHAAQVERYRMALPARMHPLAGFRAPILDRAEDFILVGLNDPASVRALLGLYPEQRCAGTRPRTRGEMTAAHGRVLDLIGRQLERQGVLVTLAESLDGLGVDRALARNSGLVCELEDLGFPVDLLKHFPVGGESVPADPAEVIRWTAEQVKGRGLTEATRSMLREAPYRFIPTDPAFEAAAESGENKIGLLRLQVGGGYRGGIIRGGSIDVCGQLAGAFPEADILASVPDDFAENIQWLAEHAWTLRRPHQLTLVAEKLEVAAWAQDNGKAGWLAAASPNQARHATLAPRFASTEESHSHFAPGESFLMDGLAAAGHAVRHSPLLFQGGNLLVVQTPRGERVLLLAETTIHRNTFLGLNPDQVREAFQTELAVDRCLVMPVVSYHLDYDVTVRQHRGRLLGFVNDPVAAAQLVIERGMQALATVPGLAPASLAALRPYRAAGDWMEFRSRLLRLLDAQKNSRGKYLAPFVRAFAADPLDAPTYNFQTFMAAVDVLASEAISAEQLGKLAPAERGYFDALRTLEVSARAQREVLQSLGCQVVTIPSMPDLYSSLNYLNGLQDQDRFIMPAVGGFYDLVDEAAVRAFEQAFAGEVRVVRLLTQEIQRMHGGLHCVAAAYPRLVPRKETWTSQRGPRTAYRMP